MTDILIGKVGYTHDRTLLDGPNEAKRFIELDLGNLISLFLIRLLDRLGVVFNLLNEKCTLEDVQVMTDVLSYFGILGGCFPHTENIILLNIPHATLGNSLN